MQLNNKITGEVIIVNKIDILKNVLFYKKISISGETILDTYYRFMNLNLSDNLNTSTNYYYLVLTQLKLELNLTDFILEDTTQNWLSPTKTKRFIIPNSLIVTSVKEGNEFKTAIDKIVADSKIDTDILIIETSNNTIVYANSVDSSIEGIVMQYIVDGIITVEDKIV